MSDQYFSPLAGSSGAQVWELSGWWRRVGAQVIDQIVVLLPILAIGIFAALAGTDESGDGQARTTDFIVVFGFLGGVFIAPAIYYCWIMSRTNGQTVGKQALGIRVVREDGQAITAGFAFRRQIVIISWGFGFLGGFLLFGLPILVDYLWPLWDEKHQALHDKLIKSRVVLAREIAQSDYAPPPGPAFPQAAAPPPVPTPVVPAGQRYVAPRPPAAPQFPQSPPPPPPPPPVGPQKPYAPPPGFENPVPEDE